MRQLAPLLLLLMTGCATQMSDLFAPTPSRQVAEKLLLFGPPCESTAEIELECSFPEFRRIELSHFTCRGELGSGNFILAAADCQFTGRAVPFHGPSRPYSFTGATFIQTRNLIGERVWTLKYTR